MSIQIPWGVVGYVLGVIAGGVLGALITLTAAAPGWTYAPGLLIFVAVMLLLAVGFGVGFRKRSP